MAPNKDGGAAAVVGGIWQNVAASVCTSVIGVTCVSLGLARSSDPNSLASWPIWVTIAGGLALAAGISRLIYVLDRWYLRAIVLRASGERIALLITPLEGDALHAPHRREISKAIRRELGAAVQVKLWPEKMPIPDPTNVASVVAAHRSAQKLLKRKNFDLLIWGYVKADHAVELGFTAREWPGESRGYVLSDTIELGPDFGEDLAAALAARVVIEAAPAAETGRPVHDLLQRARLRIAPLMYRKLSQSARGSIFLAYANILSALGAMSTRNIELEDSIEAYRTVLEVRTREASPHDWATTQNNLGVTLRTLGERQEGTETLQAAVAAFNAALEVNTRESLPVDWALVQNNLGVTLLVLGARQQGTETLDAAVAAIKASLEVRTREMLPFDWALTQNNLGNALFLLGRRREGTETLVASVAAFHAALEVYRRETLPLDWAMTQHNLGNSLSELGGRQVGTEGLERAIGAFRAALEVYTSETQPRYWAKAQSSLGQALSVLGERQAGGEALRAALRAFHAALAVCTREALPLDWADLQGNLGVTLGRLVERGEEEPQAVVDAFRGILEVYQRETYPLEWAKTQMNIGVALGELAKREVGTKALEEAVAAYRAALAVNARDELPLEWAMTQYNLGNALSELGGRQEGTTAIEDAIAAYRAALEIYSREALPLCWATATLGSTFAHVRFHERSRGRVDFASLREQAEAARTVLDEGGHTRGARWGDHVIHEIDLLAGAGN